MSLIYKAGRFIYNVGSKILAYNRLYANRQGLIALSNSTSFFNRVVNCNNFVENLEGQANFFSFLAGNAMGNKDIRVWGGRIFKEDIEKFYEVLAELNITAKLPLEDFQNNLSARNLVYSSIPSKNKFILLNFMSGLFKPVILWGAVKKTFENINFICKSGVGVESESQVIQSMNTRLWELESQRSRLDIEVSALIAALSKQRQFAVISVNLTEQLLDRNVSVEKVEKLLLQSICQYLKYRRIVCFESKDKETRWANAGENKKVLSAVRWWGEDMELIEAISSVLEELDIPVIDEDLPIFEKWVKKTILGSMRSENQKIRDYAAKFAFEYKTYPVRRKIGNWAAKLFNPEADPILAKHKFKYDRHLLDDAISYGWLIDIRGQGEQTRAALFKEYSDDAGEVKIIIAEVSLNREILAKFSDADRNKILEGEAPHIVSILLQNELARIYKDKLKGINDHRVFQRAPSIITKCYRDKKGCQVKDVDNTTLKINPLVLTMWQGVKAFLIEVVLDEKTGEVERVYVLERPYTGYDLNEEDWDLLKKTLQLIRLLRIRELEEKSKIETIRALAQAIDSKDPYTAGHSERVAICFKAIAREMEFSQDELAKWEEPVILHDVGKIGVEDFVLKKPGPLEDEEYYLMKKHVEHGEKIMGQVSAYRETIPAIRDHHEMMDGTGYPLGKYGDEIILPARIIAVSDAFDAMTSDRPYRKGRSLHDVLEEMVISSGTQFDPKVVEAFLRVLKNKSLDLSKFLLRINKVFVANFLREEGREKWIPRVEEFTSEVAGRDQEEKLLFKSTDPAKQAQSQKLIADLISLIAEKCLENFKRLSDLGLWDKISAWVEESRNKHVYGTAKAKQIRQIIKSLLKEIDPEKAGELIGSLTIP